MARYDLGLSSDEFFDLQPRQIDALIKRYERAQREREFLSAQIAACVVNFSMQRPKKSIEPRDLMPSEWSKRPIVEKKRSGARQAVAAELRSTMENWLRKDNG